MKVKESVTRISAVAIIVAESTIVVTASAARISPVPIRVAEVVNSVAFILANSDCPISPALSVKAVVKLPSTVAGPSTVEAEVNSIISLQS